MTSINGQPNAPSRSRRTQASSPIDYGEVPDQMQEDVQIAEREYSRARGELFQKMTEAAGAEARAEARAELEQLDNSFDEFADKVTTLDEPAELTQIETSVGDPGDPGNPDQIAEVGDFLGKLESLQSPHESPTVAPPAGPEGPPEVRGDDEVGEATETDLEGQPGPVGESDAAGEAVPNALSDAGLEDQVSDARTQQISEMFSTLRELVPERAGLASPKIEP